MWKSIFFLFIIFIYSYLIIFFSCPITLKISFLINFIILLGFSYYNIFIEEKFSPFLSVFIVFNLLFFIAAPLVQIDEIMQKGFESTGSFMQKFPFRENLCIRANTYILIFNLVFGLAYLFFKKKINFNDKLTYNYKQVPLFLLLFCVLTCLIIAVNFKSILFQFQHEFYEEAEQTTTSSYLIVQKFHLKRLAVDAFVLILQLFY